MTMEAMMYWASLTKRKKLKPLVPCWSKVPPHFTEQTKYNFFSSSYPFFLSTLFSCHSFPFFLSSLSVS